MADDDPRRRPDRTGAPGDPAGADPWGPTTRHDAGPRWREPHPTDATPAPGSDQPTAQPSAQPTAQMAVPPPAGPPLVPPTLPPPAPRSQTAAPTTETVPPRPAPRPPDPYSRETQPSPTAGVVPPPAPVTDELPFGRRIARRVRRGEQREAVRDAARTIEATVPPNFRVAIGAGVLAIAAVVVQRTLFPVSSSDLTSQLIGYGLALAFLVLGLVGVRSLANEVARVSTAKGGPSAAQAIRVVLLLVGYVLVALVTLGMLEVRLGNLLVGGALTGVVIGIAAQQALGNVFAGLVLLFSRPYVPGERIRVNSGSIGGPHDGTVVSVGLTYTVLLTSYGPLNIPNAQLLGSAIGPQPPADDPAEDAAGDAPAGTTPDGAAPADGGAPRTTP